MFPLLNEASEAIVREDIRSSFLARLSSARAHAEETRQKYAWLLPTSGRIR